MSITMALLGWGVWSLIYSGVASGIVRGLLFLAVTHYIPRFAFDGEIARDLGSYGFKIAANNLIEYFRHRTPILLLSKMRGPSDVGLLTRATGFAEGPMRVIGSSPYVAIFRALASIHENRDRSKYVYYRTTTLVTVYTLPFYVGIWFLARPAILFLYGEKWVGAAEPLQILALSGLFRCIGNPAGAVVQARNRLNIEIMLNVITWVFLAVGCLFAMRWGLAGIAWVIVATIALFGCSVASVAAAELGGRLLDMIKALQPAFVLNSLLFLFLTILNALWLERYKDSPGLYIVVMALAGGTVYGGLFLLLPMASISSEVARWKKVLRMNKWTR
jgi:O-antigen/teichoic acid export membrane protein